MSTYPISILDYLRQELTNFEINNVERPIKLFLCKDDYMQLYAALGFSTPIGVVNSIDWVYSASGQKVQVFGTHPDPSELTIEGLYNYKISLSHSFYTLSTAFPALTVPAPQAAHSSPPSGTPFGLPLGYLMPSLIKAPWEGVDPAPCSAKGRCPICNTDTELKTFSTFSYDYCPTCKEDVQVLSNKAAAKSQPASLSPLGVGGTCVITDLEYIK